MRKTLILITAFLIVLSAYALIESKVRRDYKARLATSDETFILPEARYVPLLAMGFNHLWAQWTMLQSQVFFAEHRERPTYASGKTLKKLLELAITLDPKLHTIGIFSSFALGGSWGLMGVSDANDLLWQHFRNNPDDYNLPKYMAFNYFFNEGDPLLVAKWVRVALQNPQAPRGLLWLADAAMRDQNKDFGMRARIMCEICESSVDKTQRETTCKQCQYLRIAQGLEELRQRYVTGHGPLRAPNELVRAGYLSALPKDPLGGEWKLDEMGRIDSSVSLGRKNHDL